jgi:hypothetical protein
MCRHFGSCQTEEWRTVGHVPHMTSKVDTCSMWVFSTHLSLVVNEVCKPIWTRAYKQKQYLYCLATPRTCYKRHHHIIGKRCKICTTAAQCIAVRGPSDKLRVSENIQLPGNNYYYDVLGLYSTYEGVYRLQCCKLTSFTTDEIHCMIDRSINRSTYLPMALQSLWTLAAFSFSWYFTQSVGDQPVARLLPTHIST